MAGLILNLVIIIVGTAYLAENTALWLVLLALNVPVYWFIASGFFASFDGLKWSLQNLFHGETMKATDDEEWAGYHGWAFIVTCLALVTAEYKLIGWIVF